MTKLIWVIFAIFATSCASSVDFSEGRPIPKSVSQLPTVQVFLDKQGDFYNFDKLGAEQKLINNSDKSLICEYNKALCKKTHEQIYSSCNTSETPDLINENCELKNIYQDWRKEQSDEVDKIVTNVLTQLDKTSNKTIVMLIHGFRVPNAGQDYRKVKSLLMNDRGNQDSPLFLEVHWDGRQSPTLPISALKAWEPAQWTAPVVGFRLRSLLNKLHNGLDHTKPKPGLFVLTHSTGAVVAGSLFGNPKAALPCLKNESEASECGPNYTEYFMADTYNDPHVKVPQWPNLNLVMLAPATTQTTFFVSDDTALGFQGNAGSNLIFSLSKKDNALNKYINEPRLKGYSGLGANEEELDAIVEGLSQANPKRANVQILKVSEDLGTEHAFTEYMQTRQFHKALQLLWTPVPKLK